MMKIGVLDGQGGGSGSAGLKFLISLSKEKVEVVGLVSEPLPHLVEKLITRLKECMNHV